MKFVNLTPHDVVLDLGGAKLTFKRDPEAPIARVEHKQFMTTQNIEPAEGLELEIPLKVFMPNEHTVTNLPQPEEGVIYITSSFVAQEARRPDVIAPLTDSTCNRDEGGRVQSVRAFQTYTNEPTLQAEELFGNIIAEEINKILVNK